MHQLTVFQYNIMSVNSSDIMSDLESSLISSWILCHLPEVIVPCLPSTQLFIFSYQLLAMHVFVILKVVIKV